MASTRVSSEGYITVQFPPPIPKGMGGELRRKLNTMLKGVGSCDTVNNSYLPDKKPGWAYSIMIKKPTTTAEWAERLTTYLQNQDLLELPEGTRMEVSIVRGPMLLDISASEFSIETCPKLLKTMLVTAGGSARIMLEVPGLGDTFEQVAGDIKQATAEYSTIPFSYQTPTAANFWVAVHDVQNLQCCVMDLSVILLSLQDPATAGKIRFAIFVQTKPEFRPLCKLL